MGLGRLLWPFRAAYKGLKIALGGKSGEIILSTVATLVPVARPIVEEIHALVGSPTKASVDDIIKLYRHFGEAIEFFDKDPLSKKNALLNLAVKNLRDYLPDKYDTPLLEAAVTLALSKLLAEESN
jgi:hypothetical protein